VSPIAICEKPTAWQLSDIFLDVAVGSATVGASDSLSVAHEPPCLLQITVLQSLQPQHISESIRNKAVTQQQRLLGATAGGARCGGLLLCDDDVALHDWPFEGVGTEVDVNRELVVF
jgi:hypothetical protein